jgi:G:T-mismatch repair DNA endonuclease (very short patch repair protein)
MSKRRSRQQFWLDHLRRCAERGQSIAAYAAARGLHVSSLYEAKSQLRRRNAGQPRSSRFVRVNAPRTVEVAQTTGLYRITLPNGVVVETAGGELSAVLSAAAQLP